MKTKDSIPVAYIKERIEDFTYIQIHAEKKIAEYYGKYITALNGIIWSWEREGNAWERKHEDADI